MTKRRLLSLLPAYNQTDTLRKFFGATVDQLFQPGEADNISGYIGEKPSYYNPVTDFYLAESTIERSFYQLEAAMVSYDATGVLLESLTYPDLAAYLSTSGALTNDHQRLFETNSYCWAPPINIDMIANSNLYYWFGDGTCPILPLTVPNVFATGDGTTTTFLIPDILPGFLPSLASCYVDGQKVAFTTNSIPSNSTVTLTVAPSVGSQVFFAWIDDLYYLIQGQTTFDVTLLNPIIYSEADYDVSLPKTHGIKTLSSGMRIRLRDGARIMAGFDVAPFDDTPFDNDVDSIPGDVFWVDGVGQTIRLTPDSSMIYDGLNAQYTTIDRSSNDANSWSLRNSWAHRDTFAWAKIDATGRQASRPIIEFLRDIELYPNQSWDDQVAPLFMLYDIEGQALDGVTYPGSDFAGSRIFGFQIGEGVNDAVIKQPLEYDNNGYIQFENDIVTRPAHVPSGGAIPGLYQYALQDGGSTLIQSVWQPCQSPVQIVDAATGLYPVAPGLKSNPTSLDVTVTSQSSWVDHFNTILINQTGFFGEAFAANNYRDSARDNSVGTLVLQHCAPLLRTMLLASDKTFDLTIAIRYAAKEYGRFRNKFVRKMLSLYHKGTFIPDDTTAWVSPALLATLSDLKLSQNNTFPFAGSNVGGGQYFIPPTPAVLGILPAIVPSMFTDSSYDQPVLMIQGHDGSLTPAFLDWRDDLLLALETLIYDNIAPQFVSQTEARPVFDIANYTGSRLLGAPSNGYTWDEAQSLLNSHFVMWAAQNGFNFRTYAGFDANDPFTWNYSSTQDRFGNSLPGHWRGIYRAYYDTDRPHAAPWEMLGFVTMPAWWTAQYGAAPYLRSNKTLWSDLESGIIRGGIRAGTDPRYARPGLSSVIPVDVSGNLLDPLSAQIVLRAPVYQQATQSWIAGDGSPAETFWRNTPDFRFALAETAFLMKPARFVEECWDTLLTGFVGDQKQWVSLAASTFGERPQLSSSYVHGEILSNGSVVQATGIQQWLSDAIVSTGRLPSLLGNAMRGLDVQLAHRMAGFVSNDAIKAVADGFGLVPAEDVTVAFYQSPTLDEEVYSGVIVEWTGQGWRVVGYDAKSSSFTIIPPDTGSRKGLLSLATAQEPTINAWRSNTYWAVGVYCEYQNSTYRCIRSHTSGATFEQSYWTATPGIQQPQAARAITYANGLSGTLNVPYGTVYVTYQEVADFLLGLERYLVSRGWVFDGTDDVSGNVRNWSQSVLDFLAWAQVRWSVGNFIALSPGATGLHFESATGTILNVEDSTTGFFGLLDRSATAIPTRDATVSRLDAEIDIYARNADIFCARLHVADLEHILLFSNTTVFNDIIYLPLYTMRQARLKMIGNRTAEWAGRLDAPGYMVVGGKLVTNFEKMPEDIRLMFDIELASNPTLRDYARHVVGYQERTYLNDLLLDDTQQFEFYQGQIAQKGTPGVLNKLLRSQRASENSTIVFLEEWAFRQSQYGAPQPSRITLQLQQSSYRRDPQVITLSAVQGATDTTWLEVDADNLLWLDAPPISGSFFPQRQDYAPSVLPTAGPVRLDEVQYTSFNAAGLAATYTTALLSQSTVFNAGERVWIYDGIDGTYTVIRAFDLGTTPNNISKIITNNESSSVVGECLIILSNLHGLTQADVGSILVIDGLTGASPELQGIAVLSSVPSDGYTIGVGVAGTMGSDFTTNGLIGPVVRIMRRVRFPDLASFRVSTLAWSEGDLAWVDGNSTTPWTVYAYSAGVWSVARVQPYRPDTARISKTALYDTSVQLSSGSGASATVNEPLLSEIVVIDPIAGLLPGVCARDIDFQTSYDPAQYFGGNAWGANQVGRVWWDLSTVRFIEPCTDMLGQGRDADELAYRAAQWSQTAPLSSVDVYEWTASTYTPSEYAENFTLTDAQAGASQNYPGTVYNVNNPSWVEETAFDPITGAQSTINYFWLKGLVAIPPVSFRSTAIATIAQGIASPSSIDLGWMAPIAQNAMIVSGVGAYLNDTSTTLMTELVSTSDDKTHDQWVLIRPYDPRSLPPQWLWRSVRDSLGSFDDDLLPLPRNVHPSRATGLLAGQNIFQIAGRDGPRSGLLDARATFVATVNRILYALPVVIDRSVQTDTLYRRSPIGTTTLASNIPSLLWSREDQSYIIEVPPSSEYDDRFVVYDIDSRNRLLLRSEFLNATSPISVLVDGRTNVIPAWSIWVFTPSTTPIVGADQNAALLASADTLFSLKPAYDYPTVVSTIDDCHALLSATNPPMIGQRILVDPHQDDVASLYFWRIYTYVGIGVVGADPQGFLLTRAQGYDTSAFVITQDWYANGYNRYNPPVVSYATEMQRDITEGSSPINRFVLIKDDSYGQGWIWTAYQEFVDDEGDTILAWVIVAREAGTLALSSAFYDPTRVVHGIGAATLDDVAARDGSLELRVIVQALAYGGMLLDLEFNEVFFSIIAFVHAQQDDVDWAFKTSFLDIAGYNVPLAQTPVTTVDETANLVSFVNEVKPYRVKVRDYSTQYSPAIDRAHVHATDFDKPPYYDVPFAVYRELDINNFGDLNILANDLPWSDWNAVYQQTPSPVRAINIKLVFDRINDEISTDVCADEIFPDVSLGDAQNGAAARIVSAAIANSQAVPDLKVLLNTAFQGTRLDGTLMADLTYPCGDFDAAPCGFDMLPFDSILTATITDVDGDDAPTDGATNINPDTAGKAGGYALADPYVNAGHPEERVLANFDDALLITAIDRQHDGSVGCAWMMATTTGAQERMLPAISNKHPVTAIPDNVGATVTPMAMTAWKQGKAWEWIRTAQTGAGTLVVALQPNDMSITVATDVAIDALAVPDAKRNKPGVVWIGGERIEYFSMDVSGDVVTLGQLRRATRGTASVYQDAGTLVLNGLLTVAGNANNVSVPLMALPT